MRLPLDVLRIVYGKADLRSKTQNLLLKMSQAGSLAIGTVKG